MWRRYHVKSKKGYERCKARKVKCDETHPKCKNCQRLGTSCNYQVLQATYTPTRSTAGTAPLAQPTLRPIRPGNGEPGRNLELRLLHYYITDMSLTFPFASDSGESQFWTILVPKLSFQHEFLLEAILGTTALHMAEHHPQDSNSHQTAFYYYDSAVVKFRQALSTIDRSTADALCTASIFLMLLTSKLTKLQTWDCESSSLPLQWFRMAYGMGTLIRHTMPLLADDGVRLLMDNDTRISAIGILGGNIRKAPSLPDIDNLLNADQSSLEANDTAQLERESRLHFWRCLHEIAAEANRRCSRNYLRSKLLGLIAGSDHIFMQLVERNDPLTRIVISHFLALLQWTGGNWWLQSDVDTDLRYILVSTPQKYRWSIARPAEDQDF